MFREEWKTEDRFWLTVKNSLPYCIACAKALTANKLKNVEAHAKGQKHIANASALSRTTKLTTVLDLQLQALQVC